jgi:hypothetical protein
MSALDIDRDYNMLSLTDLLAARENYHLHLLAKQHVVGTAIGRYLIRKKDPWPKSRADLASHDEAQQFQPKKPARTLENSEVRPYSWPCVLVFVDTWLDLDDFGSGKVLPSEMVPKTLYMPDGSRVPVCVVYAPPSEEAPPPVTPKNFPEHWVGGGFPLLIDSQGAERVASVGCLVTDGHTYYALTNRHVTGAEGTPVYTMIGGEKVAVGRSSRKQITRKSFEEVYHGFTGRRVFVNLDIGLVELDDVHQWTAQVYGVGTMGPLADISQDNLSLRLIDCPVIARGAVSGPLEGRIKALFYRYKTVGGFEYVADCLIAPRDYTGVLTQPGDSGTVWMLEEKGKAPRPMAIEWGAQRFVTDGSTRTVTPFTLATFISTACSELEVDVVRDWNLGSLNYWGAVGHYTIAAKAIEFLPAGELRTFMETNLERVSFAAAQITKKNTDGLSKHDFVPLADVPDLVWKLAAQENGGRGGPEHPNHFADMDAKNPHGQTLLDICADPMNVDVQIWRTYYDAVKDESRGLLPFRVWQYFDAMVDCLSKKDFIGFLCAAGTLAHYVGDACQPLHISHLFDGDPKDSEMAEVYDRKLRKKVMKMVPRARGVHSAYEKDMVNYHVTDIITGIDARRTTVGHDIQTGQASARAVVDLMQRTFTAVPPTKIVKKFQALKDDGLTPKPLADGLWNAFHEGTKTAFADGCACLARVWLGAWTAAGGDGHLAAPKRAVKEDDLSEVYRDQDFVRSFTLDHIAGHLSEAV